MPVSSQRITELCDAYCAAVLMPGGDLLFGGESERCRLLSNGVAFHDLDHAALMAALIGLTKTMIHPGLNTMICNDHVVFWSWCAELLQGKTIYHRTAEDRELAELPRALFHALLAYPTKDVRELLGARALHVAELIAKKEILVAYLAFPFLDGELKRASGGHVGLDGTVGKSFVVPNFVPAGPPRIYNVSKRCSSIRDLLWLQRNHVADAELIALLDRFVAIVAAIEPTVHPFDVLHGWRNAVLHGAAAYKTVGGAVLNLALLVSLYRLKSEYEERRLSALESVRRDRANGVNDRWSYYLGAI